MGGGFGWGFRFFEVLQGLVSVVGVVVIAGALIGLAVLLARYLLVATRAAQLYLDLHGTETPAGTTAPTAPAPTPTAHAGAPAAGSRPEPPAADAPAPEPPAAPKAAKPRAPRKPAG